mmetsp:Transcript_1307/g.1647  ORF Transcript_1307/g.1647 Transcript_1307/m.1647 type:complete len:124 (+) Transcript_1307:1086-1457(+)
MVRDKNMLKQRQRGVQGYQFDDDDSDSEDSDLSASEQKARAIAKIKDEIADSGEEGYSSVDEEGEEESSEEDDDVKMDFTEKKSASKKKATEGNIKDMKFMKVADSSRKERLKAEAKMLIDQI